MNTSEILIIGATRAVGHCLADQVVGAGEGVTVLVRDPSSFPDPRPNLRVIRVEYWTNPAWWTTAIFVCFALLSLAMVADYFLARHDVSEEGLSYSRLTGSRGNLKWSEVRRVKYAPRSGCYSASTSSDSRFVRPMWSSVPLGYREFACIPDAWKSCLCAPERD